MFVNRRKLIQFVALGSAAYIAQACSKKTPESPVVTGELGSDTPSKTESKALEFIPETDSTASALGYKHDAKTVPAGEKTEKNGTPGAQQTCKNCVFYTVADGVDGGKCALLPSGYVKADGWCKSWSLKQL